LSENYVFGRNGDSQSGHLVVRLQLDVLGAELDGERPGDLGSCAALAATFLKQSQTCDQTPDFKYKFVPKGGLWAPGEEL
jgi:hypothetical protein